MLYKLLLEYIIQILENYTFNYITPTNFICKTTKKDCEHCRPFYFCLYRSARKKVGSKNKLFVSIKF